MATAKERDDIQALKTDVAVIKSEQSTQGKTLERIELNIERFSFVSQKDYDNDMRGENGVYKRLKTLEEYNSTNSLGTTFAQLLSSKALTVIAAGLIGAAIFFVARGSQ